MSNNNDESSELLAHEKRISELYQNHKQLQNQAPSARLDSKILAMAKQQISNNTSGSTKEHTPSAVAFKDPSKQRMNAKAWQWPLSMAASVGILGVLLLTQRDYFIHPNNIVAEDAGIVETSAISATGELTQELAGEQFEALEMAESARKHKKRLSKEHTAAASRRMAISQAAPVLKDQMSDKPMFEGSFAKTSPMSLSDISKLAESLKREMTEPDTVELDGSASIVKKQQTLFEHLAHYQKNHIGFKITEEYLSVLTKEHIKQLQSVATETVPDN